MLMNVSCENTLFLLEESKIGRKKKHLYDISLLLTQGGINETTCRNFAELLTRRYQLAYGYIFNFSSLGKKKIHPERRENVFFKASGISIDKRFRLQN